MNNKKTLIILILILLVVLGWTIWNLLKTNGARPELSDELSASIAGNVKPVPKPPAFRKIVARKVISPIYDGNKIKFFEAATGRLFSISIDGTREQIISETQISNIKNIFWSPDAKKAIIDKYYHNLETGQVFEIDFENPIWLSNTRVAYLCAQGICESSPDGGNKKVLLKENIKDIVLKWANNKLYFYSKTGAGPSPVYSLNPLKKENINFDDKCSANFCAVPRGDFREDDYLKGLINPKDDIYQGQKLIESTNLDIAKIIELEDRLILQDKTSGALYLLKLD